MKDEEESFIRRLSRSSAAAILDVWPACLALTILTTLPYAVAAYRTPNGFVFTGVLTAYDDTFTYLAWMRQSADGHFLMCDMFTSEPQSCEFFLPLWNILGFIVRLTGLPVAVTFHLARLLAGWLLLIVARAVVTGVMKSRIRIRFTVWLYAMSSGLGWLVYAFKNRANLWAASSATGSVDLNMPEAIAFRSVFAQVHFAVGAALVIASIRLLFRALVENRPRLALASGVLVSLLAVVHPYPVVVVCAVAGASMATWPLLNRNAETRMLASPLVVRTAAAFSFSAIPGIAYLVYLNRSNEVLREWLRITDTLSPPIWEYILGFGIIAGLAAIGFRILWESRNETARLLIVWAVVQTGLLYSPFSFQRRLVEGLQLPLSIAASVALFWIAHRAINLRRSRAYRRLLFIAAIVVASLTNFGFVCGQIVARGSDSGSADPRRYVSADLASTFEWLSRNAGRNDVMFSSYMTGSLGPSMTGLRVFLGHYGQTLRSDEKGDKVTAFYSGAMSDEAARQLFRTNRVEYVVYGPFERDISNSFAPPAWLKLAYRMGTVEVFEVTPELTSRPSEPSSSGSE